MGQYLSKLLDGTVDDAVPLVTRALATKGFVVLTTIDVREVMRDRLGAELRPYVVLGTCSPHFTWRAFQADSKVGSLLPCNVVVSEVRQGTVEVAALDPEAAMVGSSNPTLLRISAEVRRMLDEVIGGL
jgi:uncharacterized protein (DUF302 family)